MTAETGPRTRGAAAVSDADAERNARRLLSLRHEHLIRLIDACVWETDRHLRLSRVSERSFEHLGYYPVELTGCFLDDVIRPVIPRPGETKEQKRQPFRDLLHAYPTRDGGIGLALVSAMPVYDPGDGTFLGLIGQLADASLLPVATSTMKKLLSVLEDDVALVLITATDGTVRYGNPRFRELSGYGDGELQSVDLASLAFTSADDPARHDALETLMRTGSWYGEAVYKTRQADLFAVEEMAFRIDLPTLEETLVLWLIFDDTARHLVAAVPSLSPHSRDDRIVGHAARLLHIVTLLVAFAPGFPREYREMASAPAPASHAVLQGDHGPNKLLQSLPRRQREVLSLMMKGQSNKQIARQLGISEATVKSHVRAICDRLGAENRTQAVVLATNLSGQF